MKRKMTCGYWIEVQQTSVIPHVTVERLGTKERSFLTPEEARKLADALVRAADTAEST